VGGGLENDSHKRFSAENDSHKGTLGISAENDGHKGSTAQCSGVAPARSAQWDDKVLCKIRLSLVNPKPIQTITPSSF